MLNFTLRGPLCQHLLLGQTRSPKTPEQPPAWLRGGRQQQQSEQGHRQHSLCQAVPGAIVEQAAVPGAAPAAAAGLEEADALQLLVGRILSVNKHPDADTLLVEEIDVGEEMPRTIVSGLANYVEPSSLEGRLVVVLGNLKARNMRGIKSHGMLLCASTGEEAARSVRPLQPSEGSVPGERVYASAEPLEEPRQADPLTPNQLAKKKAWEAAQPLLKGDEAGVATIKGVALRTSAGLVTCGGLQQCSIS